VITYDICVIGAGPAGLTATIELAAQGFTVALVESGVDGFNKTAQSLSDAHISTLNTHSPMEDAVRRGLGGTSSIWGGRCVPLDAVDFEVRDFVDTSGWPFTYDELAKYYPRACELLDVGSADFEVSACHGMATSARLLSSKFADTDTIRATQLERWSCSPQVWQSHKAEVLSNHRITVYEGLTCVGFRHDQSTGAVTAALMKSTFFAKPDPSMIKAKVFILACGGVECTRLVLNSIQDPLGLKLESSSLVGRYYMGHPSGKIADIELFGKSSETLYGFERDASVYVRRRMALSPSVLLDEKLLNMVFWLDNAQLSDYRHGSGVLSAAYLALTSPLIGRLLAPAAIRKRAVGTGKIKRIGHVMNCLNNPIGTIGFCFSFIWLRYIKTPRLPGFFTFSASNRYALHYHAEQAPNWGSTITLSEEMDALGMRRADIALKWSPQDIDSIIRGHNILDHGLQSAGIGRLIYQYEPAELEHAIREQAIDGFHQLGTLRMATNSTNGVSDKQGLLFGTTNLFVASSAVFPTSGQANPTLSVVAFAVRQAAYITNNFHSQFNNA
jgi:choline dehydrogenase-like flavoprotein